MEKILWSGKSSKQLFKRRSLSALSDRWYYYSCYGPVKDYYEKSFRKTLSTKDDPHRTLINKLKHSPFVEEQELGDKLDELRYNRNYADYIPAKLNKTLTAESKKCAEEIFLMLNNLYSNPLRLMKN